MVQEGIVNIVKMGRPKLGREGTVRLSVRLPKELVDELNAEARKKGYKTLSAYIRVLLEGEPL